MNNVEATMKVLFLLETAATYLSRAITAIRDAVSRCQNCGKPMDCSVCPYCGYVQR